MNKSIGETEKNLNAVFGAPEHSSAVLSFDEADVLFGERTQVADAQDRYAYAEIGYFFQRVREYPRITTVATDLSQSLDKAFSTRR